jgi:hypothetical protein
MFIEIQFDIDTEFSRLQDMYASLEEILEDDVNVKGILDSQHYAGKCEELLKWLHTAPKGSCVELKPYEEKLKIYKQEIVRSWKQLSNEFGT